MTRAPGPAAVGIIVGIAVAVGALFACSRARSQHAMAGDRGGVAPDACATLTRRACMDSETCTLLHDPQPGRRDVYRCRPAVAPCETGLPQTALVGPEDAARKLCEQRPGCQLDPGGCYCRCRGAGQTAVPDGPEAPSCNCACGGGAPPRCVPRAQKGERKR